MKKRLICLAVAILLLTTLCLPACAASSAHIVDLSELLSESEHSSLEAAAAQVEEQYGCGVYVVIVDDYSTYYDAGSIEEFAESAYAELELGVGTDRNCILLALSMDERDYDLCAHGEIGNRAFTDYGKQSLAEDWFLDDFRSNDWAAGLSDFIAGCSAYLQKDAEGEPVDIYYDSADESSEAEGGSLGVDVVIAAVVSIIIALIVCLIMKARMKSARKQTHADAYIPVNGIKMTRQNDRYLTTTQTRVKIETENHSNGGGTSVNSGGFSHSSGKF